MSTSRGKRYEVEIFKSLKAFPASYVIRLTDSVFFMDSPQGRIMGGSRTPADMVFVVKPKGKTLRFCMIEAKALQGSSIPFNRLQPHQESALVEVSFCSASQGFVFVNYYAEGSAGRCFAIPVSVWVEARDGLGRKSLPLTECEDDSRIVELPRIKGSLWSVEAWIDSL